MAMGSYTNGELLISDAHAPEGMHSRKPTISEAKQLFHNIMTALSMASLGRG
uniref:Uncharacterized protein n=1 Tax=Rhizophora mucronata TaxID=61149 RepID=A0A2P2PL85_RHIMU